MPDPTPQPSSEAPKTATRLIGVVIGLFGFGFALYALVNAWDEITSADLSTAGLVGAGFLGLAGMTTVGTNWLRIMSLLGYRPQLTSGFRWYFVGQLGKYIPGGLWAVLGRAELATRGGIPRPTAYSSVAVSLITTYAAAASTGAIFVAVGSGAGYSRLGWIALSIAIVIAAVAGVSEPVVSRVNKLTARMGRSVSLPSASPALSLSAIMLTIPAWLAIGGATATVAYALGFSPTVPQLIAATCYSWLAGFLVIPLPGGLGVREAVFITLYSGPTAEAAAVAVIARVVFIVVDLAGAGGSSLISSLAKRRSA